MNAPDRLARTNALGALSMSCAPVVDRARRAYGARLTLVSTSPQDRLPLGALLEALWPAWSGGRAPVLIAPLDAVFDDSLLEWNAPAGAILEVPAVALRDPEAQALVQRARRAGIRLALRGCPAVPLPPALLACFEFTLIHLAEDRRLRTDGSIVPPPPGVARRVPFLVTGAFRQAELESAYLRGAVGSVGVPIDEAGPTIERPLQPSQAIVLALLRLAHEGAEMERIEATLRRDPALMFELLRFAAAPVDAPGPVAASSVGRALHGLGHHGLARWLARVLRFAGADAHAAPLVHTALRRAHFMEQLGALADAAPAACDALFLTGAFSLLDRATGTAFDRLLPRKALPAGVADALRARAGACAPHLALAEAIERSDLAASAAHGAALGAGRLDCNVALLRAVVPPIGEIDGAAPSY